MTKYLLTEMPKLLYVDDERPNLVAFRAMLRDSYDILLAQDGEQAFELLRGNDIPLVVSDQRMPGMTGTQFLEKVAEHFPDCARMILTGYSDIEAVINAVNCGHIYYYFKKPWNESEVRLTLSNALEAVKTRRELIESEARFKGTFEQAGLGIAHLEPQDGTILRANARLQEFLGVGGQLVGLPLHTWFPGLPPSELEPVISCRNPMLVREGCVPTAQGNRWSRVTVSLSLDRKGVADYLIVLVDDLTERKLLEEQLRQSQKMEAIGALAGGVAHDFNNLLVPILGYASIIAKGLPEDDPLRSKAMGITKAAMSAKALTGQLLSFGRKKDLALEFQDLNGIVTSFYEILRRTIRENIDIVRKLAPSEVTIKADKWQMEQVLLNLVINAQDAISGNGAITIETGRAELEGGGTDSGVRPGKYALLSVSDTGAGISPETLPHIFEPFFTTKKEGQGTGLGLATVNGIIKQHGGFMKVTSGEGSTFRIYLPIAASESRVSAAACEDPAQDTAGTGTVLVVEDNDMVREVLRDVLESAGYAAILAPSPHHALELAACPDTINLLVCDVITPDMDGQELYRRLLLTREDLPAIFISGYQENLPLDSSLRKVSFLPKPFAGDALLALVKQSLTR